MQCDPNRAFEGGDVSTMDENLLGELLDARARAGIVALPSELDPTFDLDRGYAVGRALHAALAGEGYRAVGRKIGFTNPRTWDEFELSNPIWAHVYAETVAFAGAGAAHWSLGGMAAPRIEPEVVLKLRRAPPPRLRSPVDFVPYVEWVAIGLELVDCHYPEWRFTAADAVADFGVHAGLLIGTPWHIGDEAPEAVARALETLSVTLACDDIPMLTGEGRNALGSPLTALGHLVDLLDAQPESTSLAAGEVISTGTLTSLPFVKAGETWRVDVEGAPLGSLRVALEV